MSSFSSFITLNTSRANDIKNSNIIENIFKHYVDAEHINCLAVELADNKLDYIFFAGIDSNSFHDFCEEVLSSLVDAFPDTTIFGSIWTDAVDYTWDITVNFELENNVIKTDVMEFREISFICPKCGEEAFIPIEEGLLEAVRNGDVFECPECGEEISSSVIKDIIPAPITDTWKTIGRSLGTL